MAATPDDLTSLNGQKQVNDIMKRVYFEEIDQDGSYFSYIFMGKIFGEDRTCRFCGAYGSGCVPSGNIPPELYVTEEGVVGKQVVECVRCKKQETVVSHDHIEVPTDHRLRIRGLEVRYYCQKITHYEVLHDLLELLHVAAIEDPKKKKDKHSEMASFMMHKAKRVCEEWCKPEYTELRYHKFLRLRKETLISSNHKPTFPPDASEDYKEMYHMMAASFRSNREKVVRLLELMKESLFDDPSRPSFMFWVSIAMMHSDQYQEFKDQHDSHTYQIVESGTYISLKERFLSLNIPVGIKKIPVVFILFELPRFYHYIDFLTRRMGKRKPLNFLTESEKEEMKKLEGSQTKIVVHQSNYSQPRPQHPRVLSSEKFRDALVGHLQHQPVVRDCESARADWDENLKIVILFEVDISSGFCDEAATPDQIKEVLQVLSDLSAVQSNSLIPSIAYNGNSNSIFIPCPPPCADRRGPSSGIIIPELIAFRSQDGNKVPSSHRVLSRIHRGKEVISPVGARTTIFPETQTSLSSLEKCTIDLRPGRKGDDVLPYCLTREILQDDREILCEIPLKGATGNTFCVSPFMFANDSRHKPMPVFPLVFCSSNRRRMKKALELIGRLFDIQVGNELHPAFQVAFEKYLKLGIVMASQPKFFSGIKNFGAITSVELRESCILLNLSIADMLTEADKECNGEIKTTGIMYYFEGLPKDIMSAKVVKKPDNVEDTVKGREDGDNGQNDMRRRQDKEDVGKDGFDTQKHSRKKKKKKKNKKLNDDDDSAIGDCDSNGDIGDIGNGDIDDIGNGDIGDIGDIGNGDIGDIGNGDIGDIGNIGNRDIGDIGDIGNGDIGDSNDDVGNRDIGNSNGDIGDIGNGDIGDSNDDVGNRDIGNSNGDIGDIDNGDIGNIGNDDIGDSNDDVGNRDIGNSNGDIGDIGNGDIGDSNDDVGNRDIGNSSGDIGDIGNGDIGDGEGITPPDILPLDDTVGPIEMLLVKEDNIKPEVDIASVTCYDQPEDNEEIAISVQHQLEKSRKTAREKFRQCHNCDKVIQGSIRVCSSCKKVCYCNRECQKAHWKKHKKSCLYTAEKELTG